MAKVTLSQNRIVYKSIVDGPFYVWPKTSSDALRVFLSNFSCNSQVVLGIQDCTTKFKELAVFIICKEDVTSSIIIQHFPTIGALEQVPLITLPRGSSIELGGVFNVERVYCVGILKDPANDKITSALQPFFPPLLSRSSLAPLRIKRIACTKKEGA